MPPIDYGAIHTALPQVRYNVDLLAELVRDGYTIVSAEPTATLCLTEEYLDLVDSDNARLVAGNTQDVCAFLAGLAEKDQLRTAEREVNWTFGYHAPCHLKALQIGTPGKTLVEQLPKARVVYINEGCCGIAGTFGMKKEGFELSMQAGQRLAAGLQDETIDFGLSECSTCKMQMEQGSGKPALHPVKVLGYAYGLVKELPGLTLLRGV